MGCGRIGFESVTTGDGGGAGFADAANAQSPCLTGSAPPANVVVSGTTFQYTDFNNNTSALPLSDIVAYKLDRATVLAQTSASADGSYALAIPTNGAAVRTVFAYSLGGYWSTWVHSDRAYDVDFVGANMGRWRIGDGPLWTDGAMGSIYNTLGETVDQAKATLSVTVRSCDGDIVEGVTFDIEPPPLVSGYLDGSGLPGVNTSTLAPYTQMLAFNVEPVRTRIRPVKAGLVFADFELDLQAGSNVNYVVVHPFAPPPKP